MADAPAGTGEPVFWCADVGGTKIRHAVTDVVGRILDEWTWQSADYADPAAWATAAMARWQRHGRASAGIGVAVPAVIADGSRVASAPKLRSWEGASLTGLLAQEEDVPVEVRHDAAAALIGEVYSRPRPADNMALVTVGTGIGGALRLGGRVIVGDHGLAGIPGVLVTRDLVVAEEIASGPAVAQATSARSAVDALQLRRAGDARAVDAFDAASEALYAAISAVTAITDVSCVVLCGGFGLAGFGYLIPSPRLPARHWSVPAIHRDVEITAAVSGGNAPVVGLAHSLCERLGIQPRRTAETNV